jgi:hypothetical protein
MYVCMFELFECMYERYECGYAKGAKQTHHIGHRFAILPCSQWQAAAIYKHFIHIIEFRNQFFDVTHTLRTALPQLTHVMKQTISDVEMSALKFDLVRQRQSLRAAEGGVGVPKFT